MNEAVKKSLSMPELIVIPPGGVINQPVVIAANKAGGLGVIDLEYVRDAQTALGAIKNIAANSSGALGIKLDGYAFVFWSKLINEIPDQVNTAIITYSGSQSFNEEVKFLKQKGLRVILEAASLKEALAGEETGVDAVIAKGNEAGGRVGEETTFILLQQFITHLSVPVWAQGGIGLHTAAACYAAGAQGIVLDWQLALVQESVLPEKVKAQIRRIDARGSICLGQSLGYPYRLWTPTNGPIFNKIKEQENHLSLLEGESARSEGWRKAIVEQVLHDRTNSLLLLGQDISFAARFAKKFYTVAGVLNGIRGSIISHCKLAKKLKPLGEAKGLASVHCTTYPIVQGPMSRISDNPSFAAAVAEAGALPLLAMGVMATDEIEPILKETKSLIGNHPWGVGLLGFINPEIFKNQINLICKFHPPFAIIAGGRPEQLNALESEGIRTYLHTPAPILLQLYLDEGATRFIFEGNECGGHIGPYTSFVLWEEAIEILLERIALTANAGDYHILFAGGITGKLSSAMIGALAAELADKGAYIGVLIGTAYLFTKEAVSTGAICENFQAQMLQAKRTHILDSGGGYVVRCIPSEFVNTFETEKHSLQKQGKEPEEVRQALENLNLGRLRIAAKGVAFNPKSLEDSTVPATINVSEETQKKEGLYMAGEAVTLNNAPLTLNELHRDISVGGSELLDALYITEGVAFSQNKPSNPSSIAIVGMGCVFPKAGNLNAFWENILDRVNAISEIPQNRWDWKLYFDKNANARDKIYSKWGGFLDDMHFDPLKYGMPPNTLNSIEPLQLMTLEVVTAALQDAGYIDRDFNRERTSVILGTGSGIGDFGQSYVFRSILPMFLNNPGEGILKSLPEWTEDSFPGILMNILAGRVANRFNFGGVNYTIDAACASSLAALYEAVIELEIGNSDMVIAGGVDATQGPFSYLCFSKTHALSARGQCQVFDEKADGTVISEGLAVVVLKRLEDAKRDGDRIYAVIKSVAGSSDGKEKSLTAPRPQGQLLAFKRAYAKSGFSASTIELLEAHGTGTVVGDQVEAESAIQLLKESNADSQRCAIGSVKSMIGHTKGAAGTAGLIKTALSLYHKVLPATIGVEKPNPKVDFLKGPLYLNTETRPWIGNSGYPRRAGVNAFGFGGTNFHAVLEEYTDGSIEEHKRPIRKNWSNELMLWSCRSRGELISALELIERAFSKDAAPVLGDLAFTLYKAFKEQIFDENAPCLRLAIVAASVNDLKEKLALILDFLRTSKTDSFIDDRGIYYTETSFAKIGKIAFLFPGQGSQYPGMLGELTSYFSELRRCFELAESILKGRFSSRLSDYIFPPPCFTIEEKKEQSQRLTQTNIAQPALGAACLGMFKLLESMNLRPEMLAGHSYGELVALCAGAVFSEETLYDLSEKRGRLMLESARGQDLGTMAAVNAGVAELKEFLQGIEGVVIANINAPSQTVISGEKTAITKVMELVKNKNIQAKLIPVAGAFHSYLVAPAKKQFADLLKNINFAPPQVEVFSNTFAAAYGKTQQEIESCLSEHMVKPVEFVRQIDAMYNSGARIFLEVGPGSVLTNLTKQILQGRDSLVLALDKSGNSGLSQLLNTLGQLAVRGVNLSLDRLYQRRSLQFFNIAETTQGIKKELSPTTWLINGNSARLANQAVDSKKIKETLVESADIQIDLPVSNTETSLVMQEYQKLMSRFLEVQKSIMLNYLNGSPSSGLLDKANLPIPNAPDAALLPIIKKQENPIIYQQPATQKNYDAGRVTADLLRITSERTGYPDDMLNLDFDLESDLGIDSIKRVEILNSFRKCFSEADQQKMQTVMADLSHLKTLRAILEKAADVFFKAEAVEKNSAFSKDTGNLDNTPVPRLLLEPVIIPSPENRLQIPKDGVFIITDDGRGITGALAQEISQRGGKVVKISKSSSQAEINNQSYSVNFADQSALAALVDEIRVKHGPITGLIHLLPLEKPLSFCEMNIATWRERLKIEVKSLFCLAKALAIDLRNAGLKNGGGWLVAAAVLNTQQNGNGNYFVGQAGIMGLLKSVAQEWPEVKCLAASLDISSAPLILAQQLFSEMTAKDGPVEVEYRELNRMAYKVKLAPLNPAKLEQLKISSDWVILATGGARGITAEVVYELAAKYKPTLLLIGRSPFPKEEESAHTAGLSLEKDIKAMLIKKLRASGIQATPARVKADYSQFLKDREIRQNVERMRKTGAPVYYYQVDVQDEKGFGNLIDEIYAKFGHLDGVIHGAGIIEDKLLENKNPESFDRVFDTKVDSAFILSRKLKADSLKFIIFFTSVAGCFGNRGQADYAAANEVINKLAISLNNQWGGRVAAINWGPWKMSGMVTVEVENQFKERGIQLINLSIGSRMLEEEIRLGSKNDAEIVIGGGPWMI